MDLKEKLKEIFYLLIRYKPSNYFFSPLIKDILINENIRKSIVCINSADLDDNYGFLQTVVKYWFWRENT